MAKPLDIAVIGGGAAGFFAALAAAEASPQARIAIFERSTKVLAKVKISGGGRCNVTHSCFKPSELAKNYPRGSRFLKKAFGRFHASHTVEWFEARGVALKTEDDGRMFPITDSSQTIINCLQREAEAHGIKVHLQYQAQHISNTENGFELAFANGTTVCCQRLIVATGGSPKASGLAWLEALGHEIVAPVPSLFTFNIQQHPASSLMGLVAPNVHVRIQGTKLQAAGALLITHWGFSGPAVLRLSAFGARLLHEQQYEYTVQISWPGLHEEAAREMLTEWRNAHPAMAVNGRNPFELPKRLWAYLVERANVAADAQWQHLPKKSLNKLINFLVNDAYPARGKTTFKEEFVTAGGVALGSIQPSTMESRCVLGLHFAGEVMDYDGATGGFNFQGAWTTGWLAGKAAGAAVVPTYG